MPKSGYERPSPHHKLGSLPPAMQMKPMRFKPIQGKFAHNLHTQSTSDPFHYRANSGYPIHRPKLS